MLLQIIAIDVNGFKILQATAPGLAATSALNEI